MPAESHQGKKSSKSLALPALEAAAALQWHVDSRMGKHAVADADLPAGTLVLLERPFLSLPIAKYCAVVCHRCLHALPQASREAAPAAGVNPCLPRYCAACKEIAGGLDSKLAALRIKLPELAAPLQVDPTMLHILMLLDLQRSGLAAGNPPAAGEAVAAVPPASAACATQVRCTVADADALPNLWDRKPEAWRKKIGAAVRALHKELAALSDAIPEYSPSGIVRLQADAAQMSLQVQTINARGAGPDTGIAFFPALSLFPNSCLPNCFFLTLGPLLHVRTIVDLPKGTPLTVAYVGLMEPRAQRQAVLEAERHAACACARCTEPLASSTDRWLEGVMCAACMQDVLIPVAEGPLNDAAREEYKVRLREEKAALDKRTARRKHAKAKTAGKPGPKSTAPAAGAPPEQAAVGQGKEAEEGEGGGRAAAALVVSSESAGAEGEGGEPEGFAPGSADDPVAALPEGVAFWRCCNGQCSAVEPAHTTIGSGPGDLSARAAQALNEAVVLINTQHPQLVGEGESMLGQVQGGLHGRLSPYHHRVVDALTPLINLSIRKSEPVKIINYAVQLWSLERAVLEMRPTMQQLQCLEAVIEAAEHKATTSTSDAIKRSFEKKVKEAKEHRATLKRVLLGR